jgi:hypothetical protein
MPTATRSTPTEKKLATPLDFPSVAQSGSAAVRVDRGAPGRLAQYEDGLAIVP